MGIKIKVGLCIECTDKLEKPLTAKRCSFHYWNYRANLKPVKIKEIGKPIPRQSEKRKKEDRQYTIKRLQFLAQPENQKCPITGDKATEVHHTYSGSNRSRFYLDETTWMAVSRTGHLWIHANPVEARELNYLKSY